MPPVPDNPNNRSVAAILMREGGVVAIPTDTVYGLAANVFNHAAVSTVFVIKARGRGMGLPVLIASESQLSEVAVDVPDIAAPLMKAFWPGPLTLVLPKHPLLPSKVVGGASTVAVRLPEHPCPQSLISAVGSPITGTSANRHGGKEPTSAQEVQRQVGAHLSLILDGGASAQIPSTIVDLTSTVPKILRPGAISVDSIRAICGEVEE